MNPAIKNKLAGNRSTAISKLLLSLRSFFLRTQDRGHDVSRPMYNSNRDWNLSLHSLERHVVQEHGLTLTQHHRGKQKLIAQIFPEQTIQKVLTRQ
jgi:hypothetical protein